MLATLGFLRLVAWPRRRAHRAEDRGGPRDEGGVACTSFRGSRRLRDRQPAIEDRTPRLKLSTDPDSHGHGDDSGSRTRLSLDFRLRVLPDRASPKHFPAIAAG